MLGSTQRRVFAGLCLLLFWQPGCAAFRPVHGVPARYLPAEMKVGDRSGRRTIDLSLLRQPPPPAHLIDAGDVLGVYVEGFVGKSSDPPPVYFPLNNDSPPSFGLPYPVREDGTISLPYVGSVNLKGMSLTQAEERVKQAYLTPKQLINPDSHRVQVNLQRPRQYRVLVIRQDSRTEPTANAMMGMVNIGMVKRGTGKVVNLPVYSNDVLNALTATDGLPGLDAENAVYVIRRRGNSSGGALDPRWPTDLDPSLLMRQGAANERPVIRGQSPNVDRQTGSLHQPNVNQAIYVGPPDRTVQLATGSGGDPVYSSNNDSRFESLAPPPIWADRTTNPSSFETMAAQYPNNGQYEYTMQAQYSTGTGPTPINPNGSGMSFPMSPGSAYGGNLPNGGWQQGGVGTNGNMPYSNSPYAQNTPAPYGQNSAPTNPNPYYSPHFNSRSNSGGTSPYAQSRPNLQPQPDPQSQSYGQSYTQQPYTQQPNTQQPSTTQPYTQPQLYPQAQPYTQSQPAGPAQSYLQPQPGQVPSMSPSQSSGTPQLDSQVQQPLPNLQSQPYSQPQPYLPQSPYGPSTGPTSNDPTIIPPGISTGGPADIPPVAPGLQLDPGHGILGNGMIDGRHVIRIPIRLGPGETADIRAEDVVLFDGDIVFIESRDTEVFYTAGLLGGGQYTLPRDYDLDILQALSLAASRGNVGVSRSIGGVSALNNDVAISPSTAIVLRKLPDGGEVPIKVDLYRARTDLSERIVIQPGDYILLQYTPLEAVAAFFERHLLETAIFSLAAQQFNKTGTTN